MWIMVILLHMASGGILEMRHDPVKMFPTKEACIEVAEELIDTAKTAFAPDMILKAEVRCAAPSRTGKET